jgi:TRAP-type uncharacterized transport system fused permease subunit
MVVYNPVILNLFDKGIFFGIQSFFTAILGVTCLVSGVFGRLLKNNNVIQRIVLIGLSIALIWPETISDIVGIIGFLLILGWQILSLRRNPQPAPDPGK